MNLESIDLYDPRTQENWFPAYRALHEHAPVYRIPGSDTYVICKYEDVLAVIRQAADHPRSVYFPESAYLKSFVCRVSRV